MGYLELGARIAALTESETDPISLMASIACEVHYSGARFDWTGFYRILGPNQLKVGPYQGGYGCLSIPFSRGVCGAAARTKQVQRVADIDSFPGLIACARSTKSELVIPVVNRLGDLIAIFDIDSDQPDAFTQADADELRRILSAAFADITYDLG